MRSRNSFMPSAFSLESRFLLSHTPTPRHAVPMSLSHELTATKGMKGIRADIVAAFQSFQSDYFNVQTTYLQQNNTASGQQAFANFTIQPVYQLPQQVASSLGAVAVKAEKGQSITSARMFLQNRLLSTSPQSLLLPRQGSSACCCILTLNSSVDVDHRSQNLRKDSKSPGDFGIIGCGKYFHYSKPWRFSSECYYPR